MLYNQNIGSMLLGCLMKQPSLIFLPQYPLSKDDFEPVEFHKIMYVFIAILAQEGTQEITEVEIENKAQNYPAQYEVLQDNNFMDFVYTVKELAVLENYEYYYNILRKFSLLRDLQKDGYDVSEFYNESTDETSLDNVTIQDILSAVEMKSIRLRGKYDVKYVRDEIKAGEDTKALIESFEERPSLGALFQSGYLSAIWNGWSRGHLTLRAGGSGSGKAIPDDTILPTPVGLRRVDEIKVGDYLYNRWGKPTKVLAVYPQGYKKVWEVTFADGRKAKCCSEHLWAFSMYGEVIVRTTKEWAYWVENRYKVRGLRSVLHPSRQSKLMVVSIKKLDYSTPMTCFTVDDEDHLFVMNDGIVTHNTRTNVSDLVNVGMTEIWDDEAEEFLPNENYQSPTLFIATEQDIRTEVEPMFLAAVSGVEYRSIKNGLLTKEQKARVLKAGDIIKESNLTICSMPNFTSRSLERKIKEQVSLNGIHYMVFDYMEIQSELSAEYKAMSAVPPRQDLVLLNLTTVLKQYCEDYNIGMLTGMQLSDGWKEARFVDESFLAGSKAAKNKIDNGSIIVPTAYLKKDMKILDSFFKHRFKGINISVPNICEYIFKGRYSLYGDKRLKLWSYFDRGTFRRRDFFVTDDNNEIQYNIRPLELEK